MLTQLTASGMIVWLLQKLKGTSAVPQVNQGTDRLNRILAVILATAAAVGISYGYAWEAGGTLTITIAGLTPMAIAGFVWKVMSGIVTQELIYRTAVKPIDDAKGKA